MGFCVGAFHVSWFGIGFKRVELLGLDRESAGKEVCDAICQEWYPLFEGHFLFGTVLDDFFL